MREKRLILKLLEEIRKSEGSLATYGEDEVRHALQVGQVDSLLVSEGLRKRRIGLKCPSCGFEGKISLSKTPDVAHCPKCEQVAEIVSDVDLVDELFEIADSMGSKVELISIESEEGDMLLKAFGGIAAILRFSTS
jgi:peptide chain release factor subunit 1